MRHFFKIHLLLLVCALALLPACVSGTSKYYYPETTRVYPPKPKDFPIPLLKEAPARAYTRIGHMKFSKKTEDACGEDFMIRAVEYNARRVGADAVIVNESSVERKEITRREPPTYSPPTPPDPNHKPTRDEILADRRSKAGIPSSPYTPGSEYTVPVYTYTYYVDMIVFK
jgi:hypothetical protein